MHLSLDLGRVPLNTGFARNGAVGFCVEGLGAKIAFPECVQTLVCSASFDVILRKIMKERTSQNLPV